MPKFESWREGATVRRDARRTAVDDTPKTRGLSSRDTRRWCKGKIGVEHKHEVKPWSDLKKHGFVLDWLVLFCSTCGKDLDRYIPPHPNWTRKPKPTPEWAAKYIAEHPPQTGTHPHDHKAARGGPR
jgi:hypothetical protein